MDVISDKGFTLGDFRVFLARAVRALTGSEETINSLNRFPVADFDTGTNLLATSRLLLALMPEEDTVPFSALGERIDVSGEFLGLSGQLVANFVKGFLETAGDRSDLSDGVVRNAVAAGLERASRSYLEPAGDTAVDLLKMVRDDPSLLDDGQGLIKVWEKAARGRTGRDAGALGLRVIAGAVAEGPVSTREKEWVAGSLAILLDGLEPKALDPVVRHRPGRSFQVVTDSAADLDLEVMEEHGLSMIPLRVIHRGKVYGDGVNLDEEHFYRILREDRITPTTSMAPKEAYLKAYRILHEAGEDVLSIHLSGVLSGTFENALQAASLAGDGRVEVVDSKSISLGLGYLAVEAARMADEGIQLEEAAARLRVLSDAGRLFFTVRTLRHMRLGGRMGQGAYLLARLLRIRPLLTLDDGKIVSCGKVIGWERLKRSVMDRIARELGGRTPAMMAVATAADPALRESLAVEVRERFSPRVFLTGPVGALIGIHTGPGAWGVFFVP